MLGALSASLLLASCGGGGGGGGGGNIRSGDTVKDSLDKLGVPTAQTPREQEKGVPVDAGYAPFGSSWELSKTNELLVLGAPVSTGTSPLTLLEVTDGKGNAAAQVLYEESAAAAPWAAENQGINRPFPATLRAPVAADLDGDGLQEIVVVYQKGLETRTHVIGDAVRKHAVVDAQIALESGVTNVAAAAGDFDGDGRDEIAVGLTQNGDGTLLFLDWQGGRFTEVKTRKFLFRSIPSSTPYLLLATGNLDYDRAAELGVVFNEYGGNGHTPTGASSFAVYDDLATDFALLKQGEVAGKRPDGTSFVAVTGSIAIGDVDGDNLGEVLLAGVEGFTRYCEVAKYVFTAFDDAEHGMKTIAGSGLTHFNRGCNNPQDPQVRTVFLHALDVDGDGVMEIAANEFVFDDFANAAPWTLVADWQLPDDVVWDRNSPGFGHFDRNTASFVAGDFSGDGRDDLAVLRQDRRELRIFGVDEISNEMTLMRSVVVGVTNSQTPISPVILPVNVDTDSPVLKYSDAEYELVFSEPIVLAALAAAPCKDGIGQQVDQCFTSFGNTTTTGSATERSVSFSASASVGINVDGGALTQSEFELKATATVQATRKHGTAYSLSKTIIFNSAPAEDTVVFTSVPIDRYHYTIVSHPDPEMVGKKVTVNMPRAPVTRQAERGFYNRSVPAGSVQIDENVFRHTVGEPFSYPTVAAKNALLGVRGGLEVGPIGVPQGGGSTTLVLEVGEEITKGGALEVGFELSVEATGATVLAGVSVGSSRSREWQITSGKSTTYTGQVGGIPSQSFGANQYRFGLFTYVHEDAATKQQFEVIQYWVEN